MMDLMRRAGRSFWSMLNCSDIFSRRRRRSFWFGGLEGWFGVWVGSWVGSWVGGCGGCWAGSWMGDWVGCWVGGWMGI